MVAAPPPSMTWLKIPDSFFCGCKRSITAEGQAKEAVCQVKFLLRRERVGAKAIGYRSAMSEIRLLQGHHSQ
jgi:hypothetical protein